MPKKICNSKQREKTQLIIIKVSCYAILLLLLLFGPTKEDNGILRIKTNKKLNELISHRNIINYTKAQSLSWFGHINRMSETRIVRKIYKWKPSTSRPV